MLKYFSLILLTFLLIITLSTFAAAEFCLIFNFDDGYQGIFSNAYPVMKKFQLSGVLFVTTGYIGKQGHLTIEQLREMKDSGWEIGSHTIHHPNLLQLTPRGIKREIKGSRDFLLEHSLLNEEYPSFGTPGGKWNPRIAATVKQYFQLARVNNFLYRADGKKIPVMTRIVLNTTELDNFKNWITGARKKKLPLLLIFHNVNEEDHLYTFNKEKFTELIHLIVNSNIPVKTLAELAALNS